KGFIAPRGHIPGNLFVDGPITPATYSIVNKNFTIAGTVFGTTPANPGNNPDSVGTGTFDLVPAVNDAISRSAYYAAQPSTALGAVNLNSSNLTLAAGSYSATSFLENSGALLTITGGPTDTFVLNTSGNFSFAKSFIKLSGGITPDNVLFNITGTGTTVTVSGSESIFFGTVLAVNRSITIDALGTGTAMQGIVSLGPDGIAGTADDIAGLAGRVIGALSTSSTTLDLDIHSGAKIVQIGLPEPSALVLGLLAAASVGIVGLQRRVRQNRARPDRPLTSIRAASRCSRG
ncbi:MAG TPA: hypothetical protein VGJ16_14780, partial [Pirellulales bacterium]